MIRKQNILVIGAGYVGTAEALVLSDLGHSVTLYDLNLRLLSALKQGHIPYSDPDLLRLAAKLNKKNIFPKTTESLDKITPFSSILICVGTPLKTDGRHDLSQVKLALKKIILALKKSKTRPSVIVRSTLPPGTMRDWIEPAFNRAFREKIIRPELLYYPEFLREGNAIKDLKTSKFNVVGLNTENNPLKTITSLFGIKTSNLRPVRWEVAESVKIASNVFHALKVCFANEIGRSCASLNIDERQVMELFCEDSELNISSRYLKPGFVFGGPCLEKDVMGFVKMNTHLGVELPIIEKIEHSNNQHFKFIESQILEKTKGSKSVGILGLSFKMGSQDIRNSPVEKLISRLRNRFQIYTFQEKHKHSTTLNSYAEFIERNSVVLLGSRRMSPDEIEKMAAANTKVIDLQLNFNTSKDFKNYKNYSRIFESRPL